MVARGEVWRRVPGWPYEVSSLGRLRSTDRVVEQLNRWGGISKRLLRGRPIKLTLQDDGDYVMVALHHEGRRWDVAVHVLVCLAFLGPKPSTKHQALHWDGNKQNNWLSNLRWGTWQDNYDDQVRHGRGFEGEGNPRATVTDSIVRQIRMEAITMPHNICSYKGITFRRLNPSYARKLRERFGISKDVLMAILRGTSWSHVKLLWSKPHYLEIPI